MLGGQSKFGSSRSSYRHSEYEIVRRGQEDSESSGVGQEDTTVGTKEQALGIITSTASFLRRMRIIDNCTSAFPVLYSLAVLRYVNLNARVLGEAQATISHKESQTMPTVITRPALLAYPYSGRGSRITSPTSSNDYSQRRSGRRLRRDTGIRYGRWVTGFVGGSRFLDDRREKAIDYFERASCSSSTPTPTFCRIRLRAPRETASASRGQSGGGCYFKCNGLRLTTDDGGTPETRGSYARSRSENRGQVVAVSSEPLRGFLVEDMGSRRRQGYGRIIGINPGRISLRPHRVCEPPNGGSVSSPSEIHRDTDARTLGRRTVEVVEPTIRPTSPSCSEDRARERDWGLNRSSLAGASMVRALKRVDLPHEVATSGGRQEFTSVHPQVEPSVGRRPRRNSVKEAFQDGIRATVLSRTGNRTATGGGEEAARILSDFGWASTTWNNRSSQLAKWLRFCDEDDRTPLPASEGDILAYIGYLSLEGRIGATSAPQYISAISRYHELHHIASPTRTPLVKALLNAYAKKHDASEVEERSRIGCDASLMRQILQFGLCSQDPIQVGACAMVTFAFIFQCRSISVANVSSSDVQITPGGVSVKITRRKGKARRRPLQVSYLTSPTWQRGTSPRDLLLRWNRMRPPSAGYFDLSPGAKLGSANLSRGMELVLHLVGAQAPAGFYYGSHSARIGGFNCLLQLQFSREWIMQRLDWTDDAMFRVYYDSRITACEDSKWFFAHLHPSA